MNVVEYRDEMGEFFEEVQKMSDLHKERLELEGEFRDKFFQVLNRVTNKNRVTIGKRYTIREGGLYFYSNTNKVTSLKVICSNIEVIRKGALRAAESQYKQKLVELFDTLENLELKDDSKVVGKHIDAKGLVKDNYKVSYSDKYMIKLTYYHEDSISIKINDSYETYKIKPDGINNMTYEEGVGHKRALLKLVHKCYQQKQDRMKNLEKATKEVEESFSRLIVSSRI